MYIFPILLLFIYRSLSFFNGTKAEIAAFFEAELTPAVLNAYGIATMAISIVKDNDVLFFKGIGYEDPFDEPKVSVTADTVFSLASISKTFGGVSTMLNFGVEGLDTPVNNYLEPDVQTENVIIGNYRSQMGTPRVTPNADIKIRNLVSHTAGFDEQTILGIESKTLHDDIKYNMPPRVRQPNMVASYSNYAVALLGLLIENHNPSSLTYGDYVQKHIFNKLDMERSYYGYEAAKEDEHFCRLQYLKNNRTYHYPVNIHPLYTAHPAAAVYSSHAAMQKYMVDLLDRGVKLGLSESEFLELFTPQFKMGQLGPVNVIFYDMDYQGVRFKGHYGDINPFHSLMMFNHEEDLGILITMSSATASIRDVLMTKFALRFMQPSSFCSSQEGGFVQNGVCVIKAKLDTHWPRSKGQTYENYIGCYVPTRSIHTTWRKWINFLVTDNKVCVGVHNGKYLAIRGSHPTTYLLESEKNNTHEFILAVDVGGGNVEYIARPSSAQQAVFHFDSLTHDRKYLVLENIFGSFEYFGRFKYYSFYFYGSWVALILIPSLILIYFIAISCCSCANCISCCCGCCQVKPPKKTDEYEPIVDELGDEESINRDLHAVVNPQEPSRCCVKCAPYCIHVLFSTTLFFLLLSILSVLAHYIIAFVATTEQSQLHLVTPVLLLQISYYIPYASFGLFLLTCLAFLCLCGYGLWSLAVTANKKDVNSCQKYCSLALFIVFVPFILLVLGSTAAYFRFAAYYNLFFYY